MGGVPGLCWLEHHATPGSGDPLRSKGREGGATRTLQEGEGRRKQLSPGAPAGCALHTPHV